MDNTLFTVGRRFNDYNSLNMIDYKFHYIKRQDGTNISEAAIRFYEGVVSTKDELDMSGDLVPVERYRRSKKLVKSDMPYISDKTERDGYIVYTEKDFGVISTNDELRVFLNNELKKDLVREGIPEQINK